MRFLQNKPIQTKVSLVILLTCSAALLLTGGSLLGYQILTFNKKFNRELTSLSEILNPFVVETLNFDDPAIARKMLTALKQKIVGAEIVRADGSVFVRHGEHPARSPSRGMSQKPVITRQGRYAICVQTLVDSSDNSLKGWLYLCSDYELEFWALVKVYAGLVGLVLCLSFILTLLLSSRLQRAISLPILRLAKTARVVAQNQDYSVRAEKLEEDEIGLFTDAFNQMLSQIQAQDGELRNSQLKIETLINSIEGVVWEADPETMAYKFVSKQAQRIFAYPTEQWLAEPEFWQEHLHQEDRDQTIALTREAIRLKKPFTIEYRMRAADDTVIWVRNYSSVVIEQDKPELLRGVLFDINKEKVAAEELKTLNAELLQTSRQAGMAEVATGVLHNVGNVLNSVNVSTTLISERVRNSEVASLHKLAGLFKEHAENLPAFITETAKGRKLPGFLVSLTEQLVREQQEIVTELDLLSSNIDHIKEIVAMQQSYGRVAGFIEFLEPQTLVEDALRLHSISARGAAVEIIKQYEPVSPVAVDKHKVLQILINLLTNAKQALQEGDPSQKRLVIKLSPLNNLVRISITDNGIGIPAENLTRIFSHGFTTKEKGHGFGLHSGALAAREMGGALTAESEGSLQGATFTLDLPCANHSST